MPTFGRLPALLSASFAQMRLANVMIGIVNKSFANFTIIAPEGMMREFWRKRQPHTNRALGTTAAPSSRSITAFATAMDGRAAGVRNGSACGRGTQWMGLVALALLEPKWLWMRTRSTTTMITLISHNQHPQTYNGLRFSTVPGDICEKNRREELFKTKNEKHISNSSFLLVSTRFCFLLLFLLFSFSAVTLKADPDN